MKQDKWNDHKILELSFGKSILDNFNWDKISKSIKKSKSGTNKWEGAENSQKI